MSSEYAEYRVERNLKLEARARQEAWQEAGALQERERRLNERVAQAERKYGSALMGGRKPAPEEPGRSCERSTIERYVKDLRRYCVATEKRLDHAIATTRRAIAQAWDAARELRERYGSLSGRIEEAVRLYGESVRTSPTGLPERPADGCGRAEIEDHVRALRGLCGDYERRLEEAIAAAKQRANVAAERSALLAEMGSHAWEIGSADDLFGVRRRGVGSGAGAVSPGASSRGSADAAQESARVLGELSEAVSPNQRDALERIAASVVEAETRREHGRVKTLMIELRLGVQQANESVARAPDEGAAREAERLAVLEAERVAVLKEMLRGLEGSDVRELAEEIARMEREEVFLTDEVAAHAEQVSRGARERADRAYAAQVMREELEHLGYAVGEDFESLFVAGGEMLVRKPRAGDYGVAVEVDGAQVHVEPVRIGQAPVERPRRAQPEDLEAGKACCQDFRTMRTAMKARGVTNRVSRIDSVGSQPLRIAGERVRSGQRQGAVDTGRRPARRQRSRS